MVRKINRNSLCNSVVDTGLLLNELSEYESSNSLSTPTSSRCSTPAVDRGSNKRPLIDECYASAKRKCCKQNSSDIRPFKLPHFSPDLKICIEKDSFYTSMQRNKLIKEGCIALRGYCWEQERAITNEDKRKLANMLYELSPISLGDGETASKPEVYFL